MLLDKANEKDAANKFEKIWKRLFSLFKLDEKYKKYSEIGVKIILYCKGFLTRTFGKFKVKHIEYRIKQKVENFPQTFKGFIDLVLELEDGKIIIADFKTAASAFFFQRYRDKFKDYQIVLYKKFFSEIEKVSTDNIDTYFIVFEKDIESKKPISVIKVTSGDTKIKNSEDWLNNSLRIVNQGKFFKNRSNCFKFGEGHPCVFFHTPNCPR